MYAVRLWSVRHAKGLNAFYRAFEKALIGAASAAGTRSATRSSRSRSRAVERVTKGFLFDCQMCGQCVLSSTGMSCPMNCPKKLRNGPCGGVRANGHCEVKPEMSASGCRPGRAPTAWAQGRRRPQILDVQRAVDQRLKGRSSWLRVVRIAAGLEDQAGNKPKPPAAKPGATKDLAAVSASVQAKKEGQAA